MVMTSHRELGISAAALFTVLAIVCWPTWRHLSGLWAYSVDHEWLGIALNDWLTAEITLMVLVITGLTTQAHRCASLREQNKYVILILLILAQLIISLFVAGFLVHQDAAWYQILRNPNEIMPATAIIVMVCYPGYLLFGGGAYYFARLSLPTFARGLRVPFMLLTFAPFGFLPAYDAEILRMGASFNEIIFGLCYWLLAIVWLVLGVMVLIMQSARSIFRAARPW